MRVVGGGSRVLHPIRDAVDPVQVVVVDDHVLMGRLVVALLERAGFSAAHVLEETAGDTWDAIVLRSPELVLLDCDLGPVQSAADVLRRATEGGVLVAAFSASEDRVEQAAFLEMGAAVIVDKRCGPADLVALVELALAGEALMSSADRHAAMARLRKYRARQRQTMKLFELLTSREQETLQLLAEGHGAADIAEIWDVALPTVRSHIRAVLAKLGVSSQLRAAAMARDSGWYERARNGAASSILTMPTSEETGTIGPRSQTQR